MPRSCSMRKWKRLKVRQDTQVRRIPDQLATDLPEVQVLQGPADMCRHCSCYRHHCGYAAKVTMSIHCFACVRWEIAVLRMCASVLNDILLKAMKLQISTTTDRHTTTKTSSSQNACSHVQPISSSTPFFLLIRVETQRARPNVESGV